MPPETPKKGTGKFMRQGQTASGLYGDDPSVKPVVKDVDAEPRELKP